MKEGSKKRGAFNIVRYIEVHEAAAGTILDDAGILMRKTRFVAHAQTHDYVLGKLSELEADARWEEMKAEAELGKRPTDNDGPPKEPLRAFHVPILFLFLHWVSYWHNIIIYSTASICKPAGLLVEGDKTVLKRSSYMRSKRQETQHQREEKKNTQEAVEAGRRALLRDHKQGFGEADADFKGMAVAMATRGSEDAFQHGGLYMPNMERMNEDIMLEEQQKKEEKENKKKGKKKPAEEKEEGEQEEGEEVEREEVPPGKKPTWLDEGVILKAERAQSEKMSALETDLRKACAEAEAKVQELFGKSGVEKEIKVLAYRVSFLQACLGQEPTEDGSASQAVSASDGLTELAKLKSETQTAGSRPPCECWLELQTVSDLQKAQRTAFTELQGKATCKQDVEKATAPLKNARETLAKLKVAVTSATKGLAATQGSKKRVSVQALASAAVASSSRPKKPKVEKSKKPVFEAAKSVGCPLAETDDNSDNVAKMDFAKPFVVRNTSLLAELAAIASVKGAMDGLKKEWPKSTLRKSAGRAAQALLGSASEAARSALNKAAGDNWEPPGKELTTATEPAIFAVAGGRDGCFMEKDGLANLRLTWEGVREVTLTAAQTWAARMLPAGKEASSATAEEGKSQTRQLCQSFWHASAAEVAAAKTEIHVATLGPADVLYIPAGWLTCEWVAGSAATDAPNLVG